MQPLVNGLQLWCGEIAFAHHGLHAAVNRGDALGGIPQLFQRFVREEGGTEICLGVAVNDQYALSQLCEHVCNVVDQSGFTYASFVVEKGESWRGHYLALRMVTTTMVWLISNSGAGLPFSASSLRAFWMPKPNFCTNLRLKSTSAMTGLR